MHLNQTGEGRIYCLMMAEHVVIYQDKPVCKRGSGEGSHRQREDINGEKSREEDAEREGEMK